jgi:hypothetical protein
VVEHLGHYQIRGGSTKVGSNFKVNAVVIPRAGDLKNPRTPPNPLAHLRIGRVEEVLNEWRGSDLLCGESQVRMLRGRGVSRGLQEGNQPSLNVSREY